MSLGRLVVAAVRVERRRKAAVAQDYRISRQCVHELIKRLMPKMRWVSSHDLGGPTEAPDRPWPEWSARGGIRTHTAPKGPSLLRRFRLPSFGTRARISGYAPTSHDITAPVRGRLCVTVRTQNPQIAQLIIVSSSVDVIEFQRNRLPIPLAATADLAPTLLDSLFDESRPQRVGGDQFSSHEDFFEGPGRRNREGTASPPRHAREMRCIQVKPPDAPLRIAWLPPPCRTPSFANVCA
jgi:hypothetical protein